MAMSSLEVLGTVRADGTLELDEKRSLPPGRVKVRLDPAPAVEAKGAEGLVEFVDRLRREVEAAGSHFMNDEEVCAWIEELRSDWDEREEKLDRARSREHGHSSFPADQNEE